MSEGKQSYPDRIKFELSEYLKANTDVNENPITASLNFLYNHHKDDGMFKSRKEVYDLIKNVLDDVPDIVRKQDDGTYYFAKSVKQEPSNRQSIMQDIVLEPQEAENYIKHANTKPYNKEMSDKMRADGGSIQSPQFPQGAKTLENPELKNFSSASDIIPHPNERFQALNDKYDVESFLAQRENISAKDSQYPNKRVSKGGLNQEGDIYVKPTYERNPNFEFSITKKDVKDLRNGKITDELINKLENDLTHPHYEESFLRKQEPKEQVFTNEFGEQVDKNGNYLFAKGGDNLMAGLVSSVEKDENGNISFNPTKFALGFGGYSALKGLATNKRVREFAKDGVNNLANKAHLQALNEPKYINGFQKEQRGIYNVTFNEKKATNIKQDLDNIDNALKYEKGNRSLGANHIKIRHLLDESKQGFVTKAELLNVGKNIRAYLKKFKEPFVDKKGARIYEWQDEKGNRFRVVADNKNRRDDTASELLQPAVNDEIITFYSDRNLKNKMQFENPEVRKFYLPTLNKNADNVNQKSITTNEKALKEQQSVGRKLYATHRTDMQGLEKMLESNSLPAPSYAISKSAKTSEKFGDIIVVPKERQIDPKNDAFVYGGDAWTPRYSDLSGDAYSINTQSSFLKNPNIKEALKKANDKDDFIIHLENDESLAKVIETQALKLEKQGFDEPWDEAVKRISDDIFIKQEPTLDNKLKYLQEQVKANGNEIRGLESGITPEYVHSYKRLNDLDEIKLRGDELKSFRNQDKFYQEASKNLQLGKQAPASYMEAKRLDKVSFDEVSRIIVPNDKFEQVLKLVKDKGLNVKVVKQGKNESANTAIRKSSDNKSNYIYAKGGDNLAAGLISGVEEDENGNISINPTKFIIGLGGYTVAKKLLQNPKVQQGFKNIISEQITKQKRTKDIINHIENSPRKGRDLPLVEPKDLNEEVLGYLQKSKRKVVVERISEPFKKALGDKFGFKFVDDIKRTISGDSINHTLKRHSNVNIELSRNGLPVSLEDIKQYPSIVQQADVLTLGQANSKQPAIISGKQINGHYVIVEEVQTKQNELAFKTMYKVKGKLSENKMFRQSEASPFRVMSTATTTPLSNKEILPHQSQKVKPQDLTDGQFKQGLDELSKLDYDKLSSKQKDIYDVFAGKKMQLQSKFKI